MEDNLNNKKESPNKFLDKLLSNPTFKNIGASLVSNPSLGMTAISGAANVLGGLFGARARRARQREAQAEYDKMKETFVNLDTSNLYADVQNKFTGMENVYEDMTINQQQAQFQAQQDAQARANILGQLRGAAGSSGIAGLAQSLASQATQRAQQASASIGMQEAANQKAKLAEAARLEQLERTGEAQAEQLRLAGATQARALESNKQATLFGMSQSRLAAANLARQQARQGLFKGVGQIAGAVTGAALLGGKGEEGYVGPGEQEAFGNMTYEEVKALLNL